MKEVFTIPDVAKILKVSRFTVFQWVKKGYLKAFRPAKNAAWRITRKELIHYMKKHEIPSDFLKKEKVKILVIDDEKDVALFIQRIIQKNNSYVVETAHSGFSAGIKLANLIPDLIILDIFLCDIDGREFFNHLRNNPEYENVKVIGISGYLSQKEIAVMIKSGFYGFLEKPIDVARLDKIIHEALEE